MTIRSEANGTPVETVTAVLSERAAQILRLSIDEIERTGNKEVVLQNCSRSDLDELADVGIRISKRGRHGFTGIYSLLSGYDVFYRDSPDKALAAVVDWNFKCKDGRIYAVWQDINDGQSN